MSQTRAVVSTAQSVKCGSLIRLSLNRIGWARNTANVPGVWQRVVWNHRIGPWTSAEMSSGR
eukprot:4036065-Lingulodinium_polyedra.AAC.1